MNKSTNIFIFQSEAGKKEFFAVDAIWMGLEVKGNVLVPKGGLDATFACEEALSPAPGVIPIKGLFLSVW